MDPLVLTGRSRLNDAYTVAAGYIVDLFAPRVAALPEGHNGVEPSWSAPNPVPPHRRPYSIGIIALLCLLVLSLVSRHFGGLPAAATIPQKSIAVLPFENLSTSSPNASLTEGVQDEILNTLAKAAGLRVIARSSVLEYAPEKGRDLEKIGQMLGVSYVLEGAVRRLGSRVRVTARLSETKTKSQIWARRYDRDLSDVFAIERDIAHRIAAELEATLTPAEKRDMSRHPTGDLEAFDLYTKARTLRFAANVGSEFERSYREAIGLLEQAVRRDPNFLLAWCELSSLHGALYALGYDRSDTRLAEATHAVQTAVQLDGDAGAARLALANYLYQAFRDYNGARTELEAARVSLPNNADLRALAGYIDRRQGRWIESTKNLAAAVELNPGDLFGYGGLAVNYLYLRRYAEAAGVLDRAVALRPRNALTHVSRAWVDYEWKADLAPLRATLAAALAEDPAVAPTIAADMLFLGLCSHDIPMAERGLASLQSNEAFTLSSAFLSRDFAAGMVARVKGDEAGAHAAFTRALRQQEASHPSQFENPLDLAVLGLIEAGLGHKEEALRAGRQAVNLIPVERDILKGTDVRLIFAIICAWTGEKDLALQELAVASRSATWITYGQLKKHPWWDPLRGDPRFEDIVASLAPSR